MDIGITLNHIESVRSLATSPICITLRINAYRYVQYIPIQYIYIPVSVEFLDIMYSNIY